MGKKKDLDFKKVKVKIGKKKPSNNVTKFNIKTAKIVIPGQNKKKIEENRKDNYFSFSEKELLDKLKCLNSFFNESISKKKDFMLKHKLDLTQSVWKTVFQPKWCTPWDDLSQKFYTKVGSLSSFMWTLIKNGTSHKELKVNAEAIRSLNLYIQLFGDSDEAVSASKEAISILKRYMKFSQPKKKLLGLEVALALAKYCPFSFWYIARWKSAVFILRVLQELFNNLEKFSEDLIDIEKFLFLSSSVVASVIDGRRAGLDFIGENSTQIQDFKNFPFKDLYYEDKENIEIENAIVTDAFDDWETEDGEIYKKFDLNTFFTEFADSIIGLGLKMMPIDEGCEKSLKKLCNIIRILSRCCMRVECNSNWNDFCVKLMERFPFVLINEADNGNTTQMDCKIESVVKFNELKDLSKKERKLRQKKLELEQRMQELCRNSKTILNVKLINKLKDELNYHAIALLYQCLVTDKIDSANHNWTDRLDRYLSESSDSTRNETIFDWLNLGKQIIQLPSANGVSIVKEIFVRFASDMFMKSHSASKIKRISLAIFVDACLIPNQQSIIISEQFWNVLIDLVKSEPIDGLVSAHPTKTTDEIVVHRDVTLIKAIYLLLSNQIPDAIDWFRCSSPASKLFIKEAFVQLKRNLRMSQCSSVECLNDFRSRKSPDILIWDYFSCDQVNGADQQLIPLCSSIDNIFCQ